MSDLRQDIFSGRWVIVAQAAALEPSHFQFKRFTGAVSFCPFCETNEASTPPEVFAVRREGLPANGPGWSVRVVPNSMPRLGIEGALDRRAEGFHDLMNGVGAHEIVAETPRHDRRLQDLEPSEIATVFRACAARIADLRRDKRIRYVLIFKNHGEEAGAHTIFHSISQLMALPVTPRAIKNKLEVARHYYAIKERCVYCDVLGQELRDMRRVVAENPDFVAVAPFASRFPFEIMILPKTHSCDFVQTSPAALDNLARIVRHVLERLDQTLGGPPYNIALQDGPCRRRKEGYWATLEHDFHWHLEILPQIFRIAGFEWASGFFCNPVPPEMAARCLAASA